MALLPCRECGQQVSTEAAACPHCGVPAPTRAAAPPLRASYPPTVPHGRSDSLDWVEPHRKSSKAGVWVLGGFAALIFMGMCSAMVGGSSSTASSSATLTDFTAVDTMVVTDVDTIAAAASSVASEASSLAGKWSYDISTDPMTSGTARTASIQSENTVNFDFPYNGDQHARLIVRKHPSYGRDVILQIEQGQILCPSYEDCSVRVRFDDESPERWTAAGAADNSSTSIFFRSHTRFLERMRAAKVVRIQVPIYQEGEPAFEFQVGGFDNARFMADQK